MSFLFYTGGKEMRITSKFLDLMISLYYSLCLYNAGTMESGHCQG